jgi:DNA-binding MarR family transcriptional regulator
MICKLLSGALARKKAMTGSKLQQELRKKGPFASAEQEAALSVLRTSDQLQIRFARLLREHGLTPSQYNVLRILRGEGKPLPILEIAARTITVVPGITGLIDRLELAGLVKRVRCAEDRRVIFVALAHLGTQALASLDVPMAELHHALVGHLSRADIKELIRLLEKVREPLNEIES